MAATYPQAPAILKPSRGCYLWIVPRCPLCGRKHQHGGGQLLAKLRDRHYAIEAGMVQIVSAGTVKNAQKWKLQASPRAKG